VVIQIRDGVTTSSKGIANLDDLLLDSSRLVEDDEDHLLLQLLGQRVQHGDVNLGEAGVDVT